MYNPPDIMYTDWLTPQSMQQLTSVNSAMQSNQNQNGTQFKPQGQQQIPTVPIGYQTPFSLPINSLQNRPHSAPLGLTQQCQIPMLAWDPNNPYTNAMHPANPAMQSQAEINRVQHIQMMILQEQQALDATLKDEDPTARFKRYQAAYAKILQHQSFGPGAAQLAAVGNSASNAANNGFHMVNTLFTNAASPGQVAVSLANAANIVPNINNIGRAAPSNATIATTQNIEMDTTGSTTNSDMQVCSTPIENVRKATSNVGSSNKSGIFDTSSVTGDSALGGSTLSVTIMENEKIRQTMTNPQAHANRMKEGVVASAAQLTPGLFGKAENMQGSLGLADNPQIHVPCTAKCYHKCKLGTRCPRHAHKHHERKLRKQRQEKERNKQAALAAAAANGATPEESQAILDSINKQHKSIETNSSMSVCSDTFNNLDKKSAKDGKKRTFLDLYEVYNVIGVGGGGMVYSGRRIQDKLPVAIKRVMREKVKRWETVQGYQVPQEIALMLRCYGHPGIIKLVDWYECLDSFILIMERPEKAVDLFDYIRELGRVPEKEAAMIFKQVLNAAIHIQNCGVVHRDIKDENIIIDRTTKEAKLIDFGCGTLLKDGPYRDFSGTPEFYPPEWFVDREYYAKTACIWSLGVLLFDMTQGEIPFKQKEKIVENKPNYKHSISEECQELIRWCMSTNQNNRPSLEQISQHMWVVLNSLPQYNMVETSTNAMLSKNSFLNNMDLGISKQI